MIMKKLLHKIDRLIEAIKEKGDSSNFNYGDVKVIMTLEVLRLELSTQELMTDDTLKAIREINSMTTREYYFHDFPEIFADIQLLVRNLDKYNLNYYSADLDIIGFEHEKWRDFFKVAIDNLMQSLLPDLQNMVRDANPSYNKETKKILKNELKLHTPKKANYNIQKSPDIHSFLKRRTIPLDTVTMSRHGGAVPTSESFYPKKRNLYKQWQESEGLFLTQRPVAC